MAISFLVGVIALDLATAHDQEIGCGLNGYCHYDGTAILRTDVQDFHADDGRIVLTTKHGATWRSNPTKDAVTRAKVLSGSIESGEMVTTTAHEDNRWGGVAMLALLVACVMAFANLGAFRSIRIVVGDGRIGSKSADGIVDVAAVRPSPFVGRVVLVYKDGLRVNLGRGMLLGGAIHERAAARLRELLGLEPHEGDGLLISAAHTPSRKARAAWLGGIAAYAGVAAVLLVHANAHIEWALGALVVGTLLVAALRRYELPL